MLKLISNNDVEKIYFREWYQAVEYINDSMETRRAVKEALKLPRDKFVDFFKAYCEKHIEINERDANKMYYAVKVAK